MKCLIEDLSNLPLDMIVQDADIKLFKGDEKECPTELIRELHDMLVGTSSNKQSSIQETRKINVRI